MTGMTVRSIYLVFALGFDGPGWFIVTEVDFGSVDDLLEPLVLAIPVLVGVAALASTVVAGRLPATGRTNEVARRQSAVT